MTVSRELCLIGNRSTVHRENNKGSHLTARTIEIMPQQAPTKHLTRAQTEILGLLLSIKPGTMPTSSCRSPIPTEQPSSIPTINRYQNMSRHTNFPTYPHFFADPDYFSGAFYPRNYHDHHGIRPRRRSDFHPATTPARYPRSLAHDDLYAIRPFCQYT